MKQQKPDPSNAKTAAEAMPPLADDNPLLGIVGQIKSHQYARASAHEFAIGKYSDRRRKPRYAIS